MHSILGQMSKDFCLVQKNNTAHFPFHKKGLYIFFFFKIFFFMRTIFKVFVEFGFFCLF